MISRNGFRTVFFLIAALVIVVPTPGLAQTPNWNGWARCDIRITGPGYTNNETHTWMVSNVTSNLTSLAGPGTWSVAGSGSLSQSDGVTSQRGEWSINASSPGGQFIVMVSNGVATIRPVHAQLRQSSTVVGYVQQTISGSARTPTAVSATAWEWAFPAVQGAANGAMITGSSTSSPNYPWGFMQPSASTTTAQCQWSFANGSQPAPPPAVTAPPPPTPPTQPPAQPPPPMQPKTAPELAWSGFVECEASASSTSLYQEIQVHRWELRGASPLVGKGVFEHRGEWSVKGNGWSRNRQETSTWTTSARDKSSFAMFIRTSNNKLVIQLAQAPRVVAGGLHGTQQSTLAGSQPVPLSFDAWELTLPMIEADPAHKSFKGKSSTPLTAKLSRLQPANASGTSACRWELRAP